jgi:cytochrome P450
MLPSYWAGKAYVKSAKSILGSQLNEMLRKNDDGLWTPGSSEDDYNVLAWLADTAKGIDRDSNALAHVEVLLSLAAVHTTLLRMVNVLYDLTAHPEYFGELEGEITDTVSDGWDKSSYYKLRKLDSFLRESQRRSPPTILGMKRVFRKDFTFADGLTISKGTYVCMPTFAIENDPLHTVDPKSFDGFRSYRIRQQEGEINDHQFSSIERTVLNFGHGVSACPGRFFASLIIKMVFVKLLTEYEFKFLPGTGRPKNMIVHEFLFPLPWDKILIKRKEIGTCPF